MATSRSGNADADIGSQKTKFKEFCRVCTDFKTWMKQQSKPNSSGNEKSPEASSGRVAIEVADGDDVRPRRTDCPLDKDELGRSTWALLHTIGATYPDQPTTRERSDMDLFLRLFSHIYPCAPCAEELQKTMKTLPPRTENRRLLAHWFCQIHNDVNRRLDKKEFDCAMVDERWRDGWKDGSCDY